MSTIQAYKLVATLQERGCDVLLTGGLAVEAWSGRDFKTGDWDIVGGAKVDFEQVIQELRNLGYEKRGNSWVKIHESIPPQNPGEFIQTQYLWGKTYTLELEHQGETISIETVAPEWLFVDRCKKAWSGRTSYAEQALFLLNMFSETDRYEWNETLVEKIADSRSVPSRALDSDWLYDVASSSV